MQRWCGSDWAEHHHVMAIVDEAGTLVSKVRIEDTAAGFSQLMDLLAEHRHGCESPIAVAIETAKGLLVANLRHRGERVRDQPVVGGQVPGSVRAQPVHGSFVSEHHPQHLQPPVGEG